MIVDPNLAAYLARIGYSGATEPTLAVLHELCLRHLMQIPFECLDPLLGVPVNLDPVALQAKLVSGRRGGYCHEHNAIFHDVLVTLGFTVTPLGGRVIWGRNGQPAPLTHRLTLIELAEGTFIADVGFGGQSPTVPLRLEPNLEQITPHGTYRLGRQDGVFELQFQLDDDRWEGLYRFTLAPQARIDYEVANWYTSTSPRSRFTQNLIVCRVVGDARINLQNTKLSIWQPDGRVEQRVLADASDLRQVLEDVMGLALPASAETIWAKVAQQP